MSQIIQSTMGLKKVLIEAAASAPDLDDRVLALQTLAISWPGDNAVLECLIAMLDNTESYSVRKAARQGLCAGFPKDQNVRNILMDRTRSHREIFAREEAVEALGDGWPGDADVLNFFIGDHHDSVMVPILSAVATGWRGSLIGRDFLLDKAVNHRLHVVRTFAARALTQVWPYDQKVRAFFLETAAARLLDPRS